LVLAANRDFHQYLYDLSPGAIQSPLLSADERAEGARVRFIYDLPFRLSRDRRTALIVGAGTGNDVAAALRNGFSTVTSVDIDPVIIRVGRSLHPEHPYSDPRTLAVVNDARNFFERSRGERFDVVCFGLLDSHAMFSAMSTLRLDNYVYTADGLSAAWRLVAPGGVMAVTFQVWQGEWLADRIAATLETATGKRPLILGGETRLFLVGKDFDLAAATASVPLRRYRPPELSAVRITTDDWPFLYLRPGVFPIGYAAVLASVLILTAVGVRYAYGTQMFAPGGFDGVLFLMGAAFLLIETRGVTDLSLLFGSTWIVNSVVFGGVLAVAWLATEWLARHDLRRVEIWFAPLAASLLLSYWLRPAAFLRLPYVAGGVAGSLVNALPVGFAAIVFSALLRKSPNAVASLGSNLLGAVFGGCLEYVSMFAGLRSVTLVALALYLGALAILLRRLARDATLVAEPR